MKYEVTELDGLKRRIEIEIPAETVQAQTDKQLAEFRSRAAIKGYRKGKAPMSMIRSLYGEEIQAIVAEDVIKETYPDAVTKAGLRVASQPTVTALNYTDEGNMTYTAEVEVFPDLETVAFDGLEVPEAKAEVADSDVDEIAEMYRQRFSETRKVDREMGEDDVALVDLKKLDDPKGIMEPDSFDGVQIDLAKEMTVKEFKAELPGMKAGDEKEITVTYDDDYSDKRFAGASIKYHCTLKDVQERILPPFDDALAKQTGQAETALELRLSIRKELEKEREEVERNKQRRALVDQMCARNALPIPESMIDDYLKAAVEDVRKRFPDATEEEVRQNYRESGINSIRWNILFHRLAEQEKIEVLPADTEKWINRLAEANNATPEQAKEALMKSERIESLKESILEEKVLDFLTEKATRVAAKAENKDD